MDPSASVETMQRAMDDSAELNDRVDELGGCPNVTEFATLPLPPGFPGQ